MAAILNVCFVGAGTVNFGGGQHPWNHSKRLEQLGGVKIVAIVDPLVQKAREILAEKLAGNHADMYSECKVYGNLQTALQEKKIHVGYIGLPPFCHGSLSHGLDIELQLLAAGIHIFVEKPVSVTPPEEFHSYVSAVEEAANKNGCVVSVGYMFRYHPAVQRIKEELSKYGRPIIALNARYSCTYDNLCKPFWWDMSKSGGPIVEQATHFCDLVRYFGGEVAFDSITGVSVPPSTSPDSAGHLSSMPKVVQEAAIPKELQVPCATQGTWRFQQGGIGSLTHTVTLHGDDYEASLDIWCDGLRITLYEPYNAKCVLRIRRSGSDEETCEAFPDADPYLEENRAFFNSVRFNDMSFIRSPYSDAAKTYQLTWAIRRATDKRSN